MKKTVIAFGAVVALGVAGCMLLAWNTGKSISARMDTMLVHANQQLQAALGHEGEARIELLSRTFNTFSADARYRVIYEAMGEDPVQLEFVDRIEYGPLPWSRLKRMELTPVLAASNFSLDRTDGSAAWFTASKGEVPLRGFISVGYDQAVSTQIEFAPFEITERDILLSSTGGRLQLGQAEDDGSVLFLGSMGNIKLRPMQKNGSGLVFDLKGVRVNARLGTGLHGLRTGWMKVNVMDARFTSGVKVLSFGNVALHDNYRIADDGYSMQQTVTASKMELAGWPYGSARLAWRVEGLEPSALKGFLQGWGAGVWDETKVASAGETNRAESDPEGLLDKPEEQLETALLKLLANRPRVVLEELSFKSSEGESRADMAVQLRRPDDDAISFDDLMEQMLESGHINLKISKSTIDLWATPFNFRRLVDNTTRGAFENPTLWQTLSHTAHISPFTVVKDENILMDLRLNTAHDVEINGRKMTKDEFLKMIWGYVAYRSMYQLQ